MRSGYKDELAEYTTVTGLMRRVGEFDVEKVHRASRTNGATEIALTFADYIDSDVRGLNKYQSLSKKVRKFVDDLEDVLSLPVSLIGTGPRNEDMIKKR